MISMKTAIAIVSLNFAAVACGSDKPANTPSNNTNATEPSSNSNTNTGTAGSDSSGSMPSGSGTGTGTGSSGDNRGMSPNTGNSLASASK